MERNELYDLRTAAGVTQTVMAKAMGVSMRTYQDLELDPTKQRGVHLQAAKFTVLELAIERDRPESLPATLHDVVTKANNLVRLAQGKRSKPSLI